MEGGTDKLTVPGGGGDGSVCVLPCGRHLVPSRRSHLLSVCVKFVQEAGCQCRDESWSGNAKRVIPVPFDTNWSRGRGGGMAPVTVLLSDSEGGSEGSLREKFSSLMKTSLSTPRRVLKGPFDHVWFWPHVPYIEVSPCVLG